MSTAYIKDLIDYNGDIIYPRTKAEAIYGIISVENGGLPAVTEADNDKFLQVVNGVWQATTITNAEEVAY